MKKQNNAVLPGVCYREKDRKNGCLDGKKELLSSSRCRCHCLAVWDCCLGTICTAIAVDIVRSVMCTGVGWIVETWRIVVYQREGKWFGALLFVCVLPPQTLLVCGCLSKFASFWGCELLHVCTHCDSLFKKVHTWKNLSTHHYTQKQHKESKRYLLCPLNTFFHVFRGQSK